MNELETLRAFFNAWQEQQSMPAKKGRPGPEYKAADELVRMRADAVRNWRPDGEVIPISSPQAQDYRLLHQQIAEIPPKDTRYQKAKTQIG